MFYKVKVVQISTQICVTKQNALHNLRFKILASASSKSLSEVGHQENHRLEEPTSLAETTL